MLINKAKGQVPSQGHDPVTDKSSSIHFLCSDQVSDFKYKKHKINIQSLICHKGKESTSVDLFNKIPTLPVILVCIVNLTSCQQSHHLLSSAGYTLQRREQTKKQKNHCLPRLEVMAEKDKAKMPIKVSVTQIYQS